MRKAVKKEMIELNEITKQKLMKNWGEKADSLECMAEVRVYDPSSSWECFIYALNPNDEDEIECIIRGSKMEEPFICVWAFSRMASFSNSLMDGVVIDHEYRPMHAAILFNKLGGK